MSIKNRYLILLILIPWTCLAHSVTAWERDLRDKASFLVQASLRETPRIIADLETFGEPALPLLEAMLNGNLHYRLSDNRLVIADSQSAGQIEIIDAVTAEKLQDSRKRLLTKVRVNNQLRKQIRRIISRITLGSLNASVRLKAVNNMLYNLNPQSIGLLAEAKEIETDGDVLKLINLTLAINDLRTSDESHVLLDAIITVRGNLEPIVFNTISTLLKENEANQRVRHDEYLLSQIKRVHAELQTKIKFYELTERLYYGLSLGSVLLLAASGLAITFGVMRVINMAHGELIMLGAYTTYVVQLILPSYIEFSIFIAIPCAFLVSGGVGIMIERFVIRFLRDRPLETLLATFGVSLILQQSVRSLFSPLNRQVSNPDWLSGSLEINPIFALTYNRLYILLFALIVFANLVLIIKKTDLGLQIRAVSQNREMAKCMGIKTDRVDALTFGLGSGLAGLAGVALSQITNVGPNLGQAYIIDSFMVVVFGGVGNLYGTLVGGFSLGVINKFLEPLAGTVLSNIIVLIFIVFFIQLRPSGLFPETSRVSK